MEHVDGWDPDNDDVVLVNLTTGRLAPASLNGRYEGKVSIDFETGEVLAGCLNCDENETLLKRKERTIRGLELQLDDLKRDKEQAARASEWWPEVERLFELWKKLTGKSRCKLTWDRFEVCVPYLQSDGFELCVQAIVGRVFDHMEAPRKNGKVKHFYEWGRIFKSRDEFEDSANRRPKDWRERAGLNVQSE